MSAISSPLATSPPRLHVTVHLPSTISFTGVEEPQLEVRMTLEYLRPVVMVLKKSRLWPLHLHSALTLRNVSSGQQEYLPRVDTAFRDPPIPLLNAANKDAFVGLKPGRTSVVTVSFRPYDEPHKFDEMKDSGIERYKMLFPIGMQFLSVGETYEIGIQEGCREEYMLGDLNEIVERGRIIEWTPAGDLMEVVPGEKCQFHVIA